MEANRGKFTVRFSDGLGNQMFMYAFARMHSHLAGAPLLYDLSWYRSRAAREDRPFLMHQYCIKARECSEAESATSVPHPRWVTGKLKMLARIKQWSEGRRWFIEDAKSLLGRCNSWYEDWMRPCANGYASGYFPSYRYVERIGDLLKRELQPVAPLSAELQELGARLRESTNTVCVCFRRGDYAKLTHLGVMKDSYYAAAFAQVSARVRNPQWIVFSDEALEAYAALGRLGVKPSDWANIKRPTHDQLWLMQQCRHFIIGNSTFAWWAAWLGEKRDSVIVRPDQWYIGLGKPYENLFPPHWLVAPVA